MPLKFCSIIFSHQAYDKLPFTAATTMTSTTTDTYNNNKNKNN